MLALFPHDGLPGKWVSPAEYRQHFALHFQWFSLFR
jgi:hypothetical protein